MKRNTIISCCLFIAGFIPFIFFRTIPLRFGLPISAAFFLFGAIAGLIAWRKKEGVSAIVFCILNLLFVLAYVAVFVVLSQVRF